MVGTAWAQKTEHSEEEKKLRQLAQKALAQAKEDFEKNGGYYHEGEDENVPMTTSLDREEQEVTTVATPAPPAQREAADRIKLPKSVTRIKTDDSGYQTAEIYDSVTGTTEEVEFPLGLNSQE